jgi:hypothetical protein
VDSAAHAFLLSRLPVHLRSLLRRGSPSFFAPLLCSALTDFHVQLSYLCLTRVWGSFLSSIDLVLNSKSYSTALGLVQLGLMRRRWDAFF